MQKLTLLIVLMVASLMFLSMAQALPAPARAPAPDSL